MCVVDTRQNGASSPTMRFVLVRACQDTAMTVAGRFGPRRESDSLTISPPRNLPLRHCVRSWMYLLFTPFQEPLPANRPALSPVVHSTTSEGPIPVPSRPPTLNPSSIATSNPHELSPTSFPRFSTPLPEPSLSPNVISYFASILCKHFSSYLADNLSQIINLKVVRRPQ